MQKETMDNYTPEPSCIDLRRRLSTEDHMAFVFYMNQESKKAR